MGGKEDTKFLFHKGCLFPVQASSLIKELLEFHFYVMASFTSLFCVLLLVFSGLFVCLPCKISVATFLCWLGIDNDLLAIFFYQSEQHPSSKRATKSFANLQVLALWFSSLELLLICIEAMIFMYKLQLFLIYSW